jgi:hypothetical protein
MMASRLDGWARQRRCLLALLTLFAFLPSSVLAAMPVVWCIGTDGHHGIEYSMSAPGAHALHHRLLNAAEPHEDPAADGQGGCQDRQLMAKCKVGPQQIEGLIALDLRVAVALPPAPAFAAAMRPPRWERGWGRPPDPRLSARSSVVLRL